MTPPPISVVMSVYNDERYLRAALESVLRQEGVDFEFVIVDDGSTDGSSEILADAVERDSRVRLIRQENAGLTSALIRGCAEARGVLVARQDSDDISLPGRFARLSATLDADDRLALVSSWVQVIGPEGEVFAETVHREEPEAATDKLLNARTGPPGHGSVMFRKDAYEKAGGYRPEFYYGQDSDLWLRLAAVGLLGYEQEFLYQYRYDVGDISAANREWQKAFGKIGRACDSARRNGGTEDGLLAEAERLKKRVLALPGKRSPSRSRVGAAYYFVAAGLARRGDRRAGHYYRRAIKMNPFHMRAWLGLVLNLCGRGARDAHPGGS